MGKTLYFVHELALSPHKKFILLASFGTALIIAGLYIWKKNRIFPWVAFIAYSGLSFLFYADVVYSRYYYAILKIELIVHAGQIRDIKDSILSLIYLTDIWYFVDIPFIALCFFFLYKRIAFRKSISGIFMSLGIAIILFISFFALRFPYSDPYKVSLTGIVPAHVYDISYNLYKKFYLGQTFLQGEKLKELQNYLVEKQEVQRNSPYFGKYKGKNIIMVQAESLNQFPIGLQIEGKSVTPVMDELIQTSHYYPNTYLQIGRGNTSDAEFVANNSIYPMGLLGVYKGYPENNYLSLGNVLKEQGYSVSATHGNTPGFWNRQEAYPNQGFDTFYHIDHPKINDDEWIGMGISDESLFEQMVDIYKDEKKPFYNMFVSLTNHRPFELPEEYQYFDLPKKMEGTVTGNYMQSVYYFDRALGIFIEKLKEEGLWEDTIFVVYGDHYGPLPKDAEEIQELLDVKFDERTRFKIPLIIHHPGQTEGVVNTGVGSQMDIYPTLTALLGIDQPLVQFGTSLDADYEQVVGFAYETNRYTFYSDTLTYFASHKGAFEFGTCVENSTNQHLDVEACREGYDRIYSDMQTSTVLLEHNFIRKIFD